MLNVRQPSTLATLSAATSAIANSETQVLGVTIPAGSVAVGSTYLIIAGGLLTNTSSSTSAVFRIRHGTTTLTGNVPATVTAATGTTARTNIPFSVEAMITVTATGSSGTVFGWLNLNLANTVQPVISSPVTAGVTLDTTADKILELTFISGGSTTTATFISAAIVAMG